jgi:4-hydroxy-4-methyl-2-oxoglutarate aldolase
VQCRPGDNLAIHRAIYMAEPGDVLVVAVDGHTEAGLWGEIMTVAAIERGIKGLVTDGAVRDVEAINRLGFPVFARGVCMRGTRKDDLGTVAQPISIGGVAVSPGDVVIGDSDGIVVVPQRRAAEVCDLSRLRQEKEETIKRRLREGKSTLELYGFDAKIPRGSGGLSSAR